MQPALLYSVDNHKESNLFDLWKFLGKILLKYELTKTNVNVISQQNPSEKRKGFISNADSHFGNFVEKK